MHGHVCYADTKIHLWLQIPAHFMTFLDLESVDYTL